MPEVKHVVTPTNDEFEAIFSYLTGVGQKMYPTTAEQDSAIATAKSVAKEWFCNYTTKVFKLGKKIGASGADASDTSKYLQEIPAKLQELLNVPK
jgi:hypothetical protein